jgi:hypothetical protein
MSACNSGVSQCSLMLLAPPNMVIESMETCDGYALGQNYPNPFNPRSTIRYDIPHTGIVTVSVHDVIGREVRNPVNERQEPGRYSVGFDAFALSSGMYLYTLRSGRFTETRKMIAQKVARDNSPAIRKDTTAATSPYMNVL